MIDVVVRGVRYNASTKDIAKLLGIGTTYVLNLAQKEKIPSIKMGRRRLYNRTAVLESWMEHAEKRTLSPWPRTKKQKGVGVTSEAVSESATHDASEFIEPIDADADIIWGDEDASFGGNALDDVIFDI